MIQIDRAERDFTLNFSIVDSNLIKERLRFNNWKEASLVDQHGFARERAPYFICLRGR